MRISDWSSDVCSSDLWKAQTPGPHVLAGHSMGGHLVLRGTMDGLVDPDGLILSAPMLGFVGNIPPVIAQTAAQLLCLIGNPARPEWTGREKPGEMPASPQSMPTHDHDRTQEAPWWGDQRPEP